MLIWQLSQYNLTKLFQMKLKTTKCYYTILWKKINELFGQPNIYSKIAAYSQIWLFVIQIWLLSGRIYCCYQIRHVGYFCCWFTWFVVLEETTAIFMISASSCSSNDCSAIWSHWIMISNIPSGSYIPWFHETKYYLSGQKFFHMHPKLAMWHR